MKPQDSANLIAGAVKLPPSVTTYLQHNKDEFEDDSVITGGVLQDFRFAWLASGSKFVVINIKSGHKIAAWTFGVVLRDFRTKVTCVCELPSLTEQTKQLLIGFECDLIGGMVCLFHCQGSRVLRAIRLDCRVSCIQYIDTFHGGPMQCFDGTVVVGTQGGNVLAFDLNKQNCIKAILYGHTGRETLIRDELNIANLFALSIDDINLIDEQREIACRKDDHIAIQVNEGCFHNLQFILHNPDNSVKLRATRERVFVTNILYVPQIASVVVGFNFGAFQIWNLITLQLEFTSPANLDGLPITHFGFLEPCDDPRAFVYLWVIYSSLDRHEEGFPLATMYAITYEGKTSVDSRGYLYQNFITCTLRFNIELSSVDTSNTTLKQMVGGRSLACHTLNKASGKPEDNDECVLNLCQIVWECWTISAIAPVQSMMIIFDIDQWYKEHMPECTTLETNSYLSVVNLGETLSHTASSYLCDVKINTDTLTPYFAVPRLEEHFYPNSLGYECFCVTNTDITRLSTMGVQRQILSSINEIGPSMLLHPTKVFHQCIACGLLPIYSEPPPNAATPVAIQREILLSIALEARLVSFLGTCACTWVTGSHSSAGCSLPVLTHWAWNRALSLKSGADRLTVPLFDHSGEAPDGNSARCLETCTRQLGHIAKLLSVIVEKCSVLMLPEAIKEIKQQQKAVQVVSLYFQVVQWFLNVGLLPEFGMESQIHVLENSTDRLPYPVESLVRYYQNRRFKLHCLNGENPASENLQDKSCSLLFIDQFIKMECAEEKLKRFWLDDGSKIQGLYPPPSLHSLLRTYLIPEIKEEYKHSLVLYVLVDYAMTFDDSRYEAVIRRLMQFPTMFGLSNNAIKVTEAFWHLDHRDFEFALDQLQCVLAGGCLKQWQHNVVLSSLLVQKKTQSALQYLHVRKPYAAISSESSKNEEDWEACCNLYLSRGLVLEAFNLTKQSFNSFDSADTREQKLIIFFEGCRKMSLLSKALLLPLTQDDEDILTKFLKALGDSDAHNLLVMYYLQRSRYIEAQQVNDDLKRLSSKGQLPYDVTSDFSMKKEHIPKTKTRDELVDMYCKTLPKVTRNLAHLVSGNVLGKKMSMPTPMTVSLQASAPKPVTYRSSIIQATINKANETWLERPGVARSLKRALQVEDTPFICTPKMVRHSSRLGPVEKMNTTPDDIFKGTPAKRPRLEEIEQDDKSVSEYDISQDPRLKEEVEALLHTPVVKRRSQWRCGSQTSDRSSVERISVREATPQSILKVRKLLDGDGSIDIHFVETDDELETASLNTQSDNLSRSIRFNIPSTGNTPSPSMSPSEFNDNFEELSGIKPFSRTSFKNQTSSIHVSPRKSIHQSYEEDKDESMTTSVSTPIKRTPPRGRNLLSESNLSQMNSNNTYLEEPLWLSAKSTVPLGRELKTPEIEMHSSECSDFGDKTICPDETDVISTDIKTQFDQDIEYIGNIETPSYTEVEENQEISTRLSPFEKLSTIVEKSEDSFTKDISPIKEGLKDLVKRGPQPRRSLRLTPERSISNSVQPSPSSTRSLRSRGRTPEHDPTGQINFSPIKSTPSQSRIKKSLARKVLEANALSITREIISNISVTVSESSKISESVSITSSKTEESHKKDVTDTSISDTSKYHSLVTSKYIESLRSNSTFNDSLLPSDVSESESDASYLETVTQNLTKNTSKLSKNTSNAKQETTLCQSPNLQHLDSIKNVKMVSSLDISSIVENSLLASDTSEVISDVSHTEEKSDSCIKFHDILIEEKVKDVNENLDKNIISTDITNVSIETAEMNVAKKIVEKLENENVDEIQSLHSTNISLEKDAHEKLDFVTNVEKQNDSETNIMNLQELRKSTVIIYSTPKKNICSEPMDTVNITESKEISESNLKLNLSTVEIKESNQTRTTSPMSKDNNLESEALRSDSQEYHVENISTPSSHTIEELRNESLKMNVPVTQKEEDIDIATDNLNSEESNSNDLVIDVEFEKNDSEDDMNISVKKDTSQNSLLDSDRSSNASDDENDSQKAISEHTNQENTNSQNTVQSERNKSITTSASKSSNSSNHKTHNTSEDANSRNSTPASMNSGSSNRKANTFENPNSRNSSVKQSESDEEDLDKGQAEDASKSSDYSNHKTDNTFEDANSRNSSVKQSESDEEDSDKDQAEDSSKSSDYSNHKIDNTFEDANSRNSSVKQSESDEEGSNKSHAGNASDEEDSDKDQAEDSSKSSGSSNHKADNTSEDANSQNNSEKQSEFDEEDSDKDQAEEDENERSDDETEEEIIDEEESDGTSETSDNDVYIEDNSEDVANRAILGDTSEVINIISSDDDSQSKTENLVKNDSILNQTNESIVSSVIKLKCIKSSSATDVISQSDSDNTNNIDQENNVSNIKNTKLDDEIVLKADLSDASAAMQKLESHQVTLKKNLTNPEEHKIMESDEIDPLSTDVDKNNVTLTQADINNMSLMTEEGSLLEEPISLNLSEDEDDSKLQNVVNEVVMLSAKDQKPEEEVISNTIKCVEETSKGVLEDKRVAKDAEENTIVTNVIIQKDISVETPEQSKTNKVVDLVENILPSDDKEIVSSKSSTMVVENSSLNISTIESNKQDISQNLNLSSKTNTPQKITRRRSSVQNASNDQKEPDSKSTPKSLNESGSDLDTSIAKSTRSATKRKLDSSKHDKSNVSLNDDSFEDISQVEDDDKSVFSNASSRRSKRNSSKHDTSFGSDVLPADDNESVSSVRKSRRTTMVRPNLSVIPEMSQVESEKSLFDKTDLSKSNTHDTTGIDQYSASRRLTRHQRSILEKSLESTPRKIASISKRRSSVQSNEGTIYENTESETSHKDVEEVENKSFRKNITGKTLDPIKLLNKEDFKGEPDLEEIHNIETASVSSLASSVASDFTRTIPVRSKRASSEVGTPSKGLRKTRRPSLDVTSSPIKTGTPVMHVSTPISVLDESITGSGSRPRRQSFNKAIEALSTPKRRRRPSTDSKNDTDGASDVSMTDKMTPNILKETLLNELNQSKLLVIEEDDDGEDKTVPPTSKPVKKVRKAASVHGYVSPDPEKVQKDRKARMSQLLTPLSKEDQLDLEDVSRPRFRRRTASYQVIDPIKFIVKKK